MHMFGGAVPVTDCPQQLPVPPLPYSYLRTTVN